MKYKLKKGDKVIVIAGADKGKTGSVLEVNRKTGRAIVEGVRIVKKHQKPTNDNPGGITEMPAAVDMSNLMLVDPKSGEPTRVGRKIVDNKVVRYSKKSGEIIK